MLDNPAAVNKVHIEKLEKGELMINYSSQLHLVDIKDGAAGNYQCVIRNKFGSAYSRKANISIHGTIMWFTAFYIYQYFEVLVTCSYDKKSVWKCGMLGNFAEI